jgi:hypothetical protein
MIVNNLFVMSATERDAIPDEAILDMAYGIRHYEPYGVDQAEAVRQLGIISELQRRLDALATPAAVPAPLPLIHCDCGHTVPRALAMTTSTGTSCSECYDRMSE